MFEDIDVIKSMSREEYRQVLYYLKNPNEYEGDYQAFMEKIIDFSARVNDRKECVFRMKKKEE